MITKSHWRTRMSEDVRLADHSPKMQQAYLLAARQLVDWVECEPATWTEEDVPRYFFYVREEKRLAPSSINVRLHGIRLFVEHTVWRAACWGPESVCDDAKRDARCPRA